jgi:hypothetical protein
LGSGKKQEINYLEKQTNFRTLFILISLGLLLAGCLFVCYLLILASSSHVKIFELSGYILIGGMFCSLMFALPNLFLIQILMHKKLFERFSKNLFYLFPLISAFIVFSIYASPFFSYGVCVLILEFVVFVLGIKILNGIHGY